MCGKAGPVTNVVDRIRSDQSTTMTIKQLPAAAAPDFLETLKGTFPESLTEARARLWKAATTFGATGEAPSLEEVRSCLTVLGAGPSEWARLTDLAREHAAYSAHLSASSADIDAAKLALDEADAAWRRAKLAEKADIDAAKARTAAVWSSRCKVVQVFDAAMNALHRVPRPPSPFPDADAAAIAALELELREASATAQRLRGPAHEAAAALDALKADHRQADYVRARRAAGVPFEATWERAGLDQQQPRGRDFTAQALAEGAAEREAAELERAEQWHAAALERIDAATARVAAIERQLSALKN